MSRQADQAPGRANLGFAGGFDEELDRFDPAEWCAPARPRPKPAPEAQAASRQLAEATGFRSREPGAGEGASRGRPAATPKPEAEPKPAPRPQRRRRTGRNAQFNIKAKPETIEAFCAAADAHGWGLGETLEHAVTLLAADLEAKGKRRG